ncbi:MAG: DUF1801 domain-containing protein [Chloracidobacterium sp.]|nr:DUF1801 domain-containing protein [Chloracidobacterium sp.]
MAKAEIKTKQTDANVEDFINSVENEERRNDAFRVLEMFKRITGEEPKMWGPAIIGFGDSKYKYPDGREMDWMITAFSPRKQNLTLYVICDSPKQPELLAKLGKHTSSVSCLYIKRLSDVDEKVLEKIITDSVSYTKKNK